MIRSIQSTLSKKVKPKKYYQTFTFYVPAPPVRNSGYREKELDKQLYNVFKQGFVLESLTTESHNGSRQEGMWVIAVVSTTDEKLNKFDPNFPESLQEKIPDLEIIHDDGEE